MDEIHGLSAVAEDQQWLAGSDPLHPADEDLGVGAMRVHTRAVGVEIAQRHVVEAVLVIERTQHALVERLGAAVQRAVVVGVMVFGGRKRIGQSVDGGRRSGDDAGHARVHGRLQHVERAVHQHVDGEGRLFRALGDAQRSLMEDDVNAVHHVGDQSAIAHVTLDDGDASTSAGSGQILTAAANKVVQHDDLAHTVIQQLIGDVRANEAGTAGDEHTSARKS
jgi:hypothetical protein